MKNEHVIGFKLRRHYIGVTIIKTYNLDDIGYWMVAIQVEALQSIQFLRCAGYS